MFESKNNITTYLSHKTTSQHESENNIMTHRLGQKTTSRHI